MKNVRDKVVDEIDCRASYFINCKNSDQVLDQIENNVWADVHTLVCENVYDIVYNQMLKSVKNEER